MTFSEKRKALQSPLALLGEHYHRAENGLKFEAFFDRQTRNKALRKIHRQNLQAIKADADAILETKLTRLTSREVPNAASELEKELIETVAQQYERRVPYVPPTFYPPRFREGMKTKAQLKRERSRRNIVIKQNRRNLGGVYGQITAAIKTSRARKRPSTARPSGNTGVTGVTGAAGTTNGIGGTGGTGATGRTTHKPPRPSTAPTTRQGTLRQRSLSGSSSAMSLDTASTSTVLTPLFQLGPFGTAFDELWQLKKKAVAERQAIHKKTPATATNIAERQRYDRQHTKMKTMFRPGSATRRVKGTWGSRVLDVRLETISFEAVQCLLSLVSISFFKYFLQCCLFGCFFCVEVLKC